MFRDFLLVALIMLIFILAVTLSIPAKAHSWYDQECCNDQDCAPAKQVTEVHNGWKVIDSKGAEHFVPRYGGPRIKPSRDEKYHICVNEDEIGYPYVLCLYIPSMF
mgnify:CR=1 FL=1